VCDGKFMRKKKSASKKLGTRDRKKFEALLLSKRAEILSNVTSMEGESLKRERSDLSNMPIHMADMGSDNFDLENTLGLMESERKILHEIDIALSRLKEGTYMTCEGCESPISKARLEAIPWARYCVQCASLIEKGVVKKEDIFNRYGYVDGIEDDGKDNDDEMDGVAGVVR